MSPTLSLMIKLVSVSLGAKLRGPDITATGKVNGIVSLLALLFCHFVLPLLLVLDAFPTEEVAVACCLIRNKSKTDMPK